MVCPFEFEEGLMRIARMIPPVAVAYAVALGSAGLSGGCSNSVPDGGQVPVNEKQQDRIRGGMKGFLDQQAEAKKQARKAKLPQRGP